MSINLRSSGGNSLFPEGHPSNQPLTWSNFSAVSNVDFGGNQIQNVSVLETQDISGLDAGDILPLIEGGTLNNFVITDLASYDIRVENDLSLGGRLLSQEFQDLSTYTYSIVSGGGSVYDISAEFYDLSADFNNLRISGLLDLCGNADGKTIYNLQRAVIGTSTINSNVVFDVSGKARATQGFSIGDSLFPSGSEKMELNFDISQNVYSRWKHFGFTYGYFIGLQTATTGGARHELLDPQSIHFITTPNTPGNRYITLSVNSNRTITIPGYTSGTLSVDGAGVVQSSSDRRAKKNIVYADDLHGLDVVNGLKPARFSFNTERDEDRHLGFIADDVLSIFPDAVDGKKYPYHFLYDISGDDIHTQEKILRVNPDGTPVMDTTNPRMKGLDNTAIIAVLVKAVQELNSKVDKLTKLVLS